MMDNGFCGNFLFLKQQSIYTVHALSLLLLRYMLKFSVCEINRYVNLVVHLCIDTIVKSNKRDTSVPKTYFAFQDSFFKFFWKKTNVLLYENSSVNIVFN